MPHIGATEVETACLLRVPAAQGFPPIRPIGCAHERSEKRALLGHRLVVRAQVHAPSRGRVGRGRRRSERQAQHRIGAVLGALALVGVIAGAFVVWRKLRRG